MLARANKLLAGDDNPYALAVVYSVTMNERSFSKTVRTPQTSPAMGGPPAGGWLERAIIGAILGAGGILTILWVGFLGWSVVWLFS
jgi:hypothetical protein